MVDDDAGWRKHNDTSGRTERGSPEWTVPMEATPSKAPTPTGPSGDVPRHLAPSSSPGGYRSWSAWIRIGAPALGAFLFLGVVAASVTNPPDERTEIDSAAPSETTPEPDPTTTDQPTTTTTVATTTTTAPPPPPPTTAPPTTQPAVVAPPPAPEPRAETVPEPPPEPEPEPGGGCDPNYSGCVPVASDVDCAGGSGNGPAYVEGPVSILGIDIYGLDNDGDGVGCES